MRRVLFDEDTPRQLRRDLSGYAIRTVQEEGWSSVKNGELLRLASAKFDVLVMADQRLQYQQNIPSFAISVVVIVAVDTRLPHLRTLLSQLRLAIDAARPGTVTVVKS